MNHESCPSHSPFLTRTTCQQPSEPELRPAERTRRCLARDCASLPLVARQRKGTWHCAAMCALQVLLCARSTGTELENLQKLKCIEMARQEPLLHCAVERSTAILRPAASVPLLLPSPLPRRAGTSPRRPGCSAPPAPEPASGVTERVRARVRALDRHLCEHILRPPCACARMRAYVRACARACACIRACVGRGGGGGGWAGMFLWLYAFVFMVVPLCPCLFSSVFVFLVVSMFVWLWSWLSA